MLFGLGDTSLQWGLGARLLSLAQLTACIPFAALVSTMKNDEVLAIADRKDRELIRFSVGETFDANVKVLRKFYSVFSTVFLLCVSCCLLLV